MKNYYTLLGIEQTASASEIKKAFRDKAKQIHPDIAGSSGDAMRKLIAAYEILSNPERRFEYDRIYTRFVKKDGFNYRTWLAEQEKPQYQAKLIFYELLNLEEEKAISIWRKNGGLNFQLEKFMDREDWLDCQFILGEELEKRGDSFEAFKLLSAVLAEERRRPYFKIFTPEIELILKNLVKSNLRAKVDDETWIECMETMINLGFPEKDEKYFLRSIESTWKKVHGREYIND